MHSNMDMIESRSSGMWRSITLKSDNGSMSPVAVHLKICPGVQKDCPRDRSCGLHGRFPSRLPHGALGAHLDLRAENHFALLAL